MGVGRCPRREWGEVSSLRKGWGRGGGVGRSRSVRLMEVVGYGELWYQLATGTGSSRIENLGKGVLGGGA